MTNLLTLLAEAECWLGVEPLGEEQWAEVAELRERVAKALAPATVGCKLCHDDPSARVWLTRADGSQEAVRCPHPVASAPASEKEPLPSAASSFLETVAARRNADGLE